MDDAVFFTQFVIQNLVQFPEHVQVDKTNDERGVLLSVTVEPSDMGRIIGKRGITVHAIRTLLHVLAVKHSTRYSLKIIDVNPEEESE